jgi:predicted O-methyltransferase YrrM
LSRAGVSRFDRREDLVLVFQRPGTLRHGGTEPHTETPLGEVTTMNVFLGTGLGRVLRRPFPGRSSHAGEILRRDRRPFVPDGHYYSPVVNIADVERDQERIWPRRIEAPLGVDFNRPGHETFLSGPFRRFIGDFRYPVDAPRDGDLTRYYERNVMFSKLDARVLFVMLRWLRPRRVVEIGSGFSSLLTADVNRRFLEGTVELTCVEPDPPDYLRNGVRGITRLLPSRVQDLPELHLRLEAGDILFIDSSHVAKTGSDVNHLYFELLPRLAPGVVVHIHDIFLPLDYPKYWVLGGRSWNEQYLVRAMLTYSHAFKVLFSSSYACHCLKEELTEALGGDFVDGSSLWLERTSLGRAS